MKKWEFMKGSVQNAAISVPSVAIVVLNYNNWTLTEQCLLRLAELEYSNYRIVVVDNGSSTHCPERMTPCFTKAEFIFNPNNLGYSEGCNCGIRHAQKWNPDYVWLLNNDTEVDPGSLTAMVRLLESDSDLGAAGCVLRDPGPEGAIQAWGGGMISFLSGLPRHLKQENGSRLQYLCGASVLLRTVALNQVGLLDPRFFLYWEDADLCFRLRAAGWHLGVANGATVVHRDSATARFQSVPYDYHFMLSSVRFYRRYSRHWWLPVFVSLAGRMMMRAFKGRVKNSIAVWRGFRDALITVSRSKIGCQNPWTDAGI